MITEWEKCNKVMLMARCFRYLEALELAEDIFVNNAECCPEFSDAEKACIKAKDLIQKRVSKIMEDGDA